MTECPFKDRCWRRSYSAYYSDQRFDHTKVPTRSELFFLGLATEAMASTHESNGKTKYGGIYMEVFPKERHLHCPILLAKNFMDCNEYKKEANRQAKFEASRQRHKDYVERVFKRPPIAKDVRRFVALRDKYKCVYCCRHVSEFKGTGAMGQIDHFIPWAKGGEHNEDNFVYACSTCNLSKQDAVWDRGCRRGFYKMNDFESKHL